jgi:hypothetical protein
MEADVYGLGARYRKQVDVHSGTAGLFQTNRYGKEANGQEKSIPEVFGALFYL